MRSLASWADGEGRFLVLDPDDPKHGHALERLGREPVLWLTTVRGDGQPQSSPVWFVWDGSTFLVYSVPSSPKVPNIRANPQVSMHLADDGAGGDIVTLEGTAQILEDAPRPDRVPAYVEKYRGLIEEMGANPEQFGGMYAAAIRITPTRVRVYE
jgi:PPOX class probable F420-dependent enzyme